MDMACYEWNETCSGHNDDEGNATVGAGQIYCQAGTSSKCIPTPILSTNSKRIAWCCNAQYETCTERPNQINICLAKFPNPQQNVSVDIANSIQASYLSSARVSGTASPGSNVGISTTLEYGTLTQVQTSPTPTMSSPDISSPSNNTAADRLKDSESVASRGSFQLKVLE
jgi:hypothetical protein